jgi:hypothetical protein
LSHGVCGHGTRSMVVRMPVMVRSVMGCVVCSSDAFFGSREFVNAAQTLGRRQHAHFSASRRVASPVSSANCVTVGSRALRRLMDDPEESPFCG